MTEKVDVDQLRQQLEGLQRAMAAPLPSAEELAAGKAEDRAMAERICATRPGIPLHHAFATLETLRVIQRLDTAQEDKPCGQDSTGHDASPSGSDEAQRLADVIANARMSTLQAAFRLLGWPITFSVDDAEEQPKPWRRDSVTDDHLQAVAQVYRQALANGQPPTRTVATHFAVGYSTAGRWVRLARTEGHLGATTPGTASA